MKKTKFILEIIWLFFYRKSCYYKINRINYVDMNYIRCWLYRIDYILYFIPIHIPIDSTHNIGDGMKKVGEWYQLYDQRLNGKHTITEREYTK